MAFTWNYSAVTQTTIKSNEWEEIKTNLDSLDDYVNCSSKCTSQDLSKDANYNSGVDLDYDSLINSSKDIGIDSTKNIGINNGLTFSSNSSNNKNIYSSDDGYFKTSYNTPIDTALYYVAHSSN